jgi:hypothetical protein
MSDNQTKVKTVTVAPIPDKAVGELLDEKLYAAVKELSIIDEKKLEETLSQSKNLKVPFDEMLYKNDLIDNTTLGKIIGDLIGIPYVNLAEVAIAPTLTHVIPEEFARRNKLMPFELTDTAIKVAVVQPVQNQLVKKFIEQKVHRPITFYYTTEREFEKSLKVFKQNLQRSYDIMLADQVAEIGKEGISEAPIKKQGAL